MNIVAFPRAIAAATCLILLSPVIASAQTSRPSPVERALKLAPEGAAAVIHIEVKPVVKGLLEGLAKGLEPNALPEAFMKAAEDLSQKIDSADVFVVPTAGAAPMPIVVFQGTATPEDINSLLKTVPNLPPGMKFEKKADGIYAAGPEQMPILLLTGGGATGLPEGMLVAGPASVLTNEFLPNMGKGRNEPLRQLLQGVDTAAPIWLAAQMDRIGAVGEAPRTVTASWYLLGGGTSKMAFEFQDANVAGRFVEDFQGGGALAKAVLSSMALRKEGAKVQFASKSKDSLVPMIVDCARAYMAESLARAHRAVSMANLRSIGAAAFLFASVNKGHLPPDLPAIWRDSFNSQEKALAMFVSPASGKKPKANEKGEFGFDPDYVYVRMPVTADKIEDPVKMVLAYERPEDYKNETTIVLYADGHCEVVKMAEFSKQLKATQDWIAAREKEAKKDK